MRIYVFLSVAFKDVSQISDAFLIFVLHIK